MKKKYIPRRIMVPLTEQESVALAKLAEHEEREPRRQAALLLREGLQRSGFLSVGQRQCENCGRKIEAGCGLSDMPFCSPDCYDEWLEKQEGNDD